MRVILSRKGVDSGNSALSNLVITKGNNKQIIMIPIPEENDKLSYNNISFSENNFFDFNVKEYIKSKNVNLNTKCHIDLNLSNYHKDNNFIGSIGQVGISQSHLEKYNIGVGDIFLFFGRFSFAEICDDNICLNPTDKQMLFGYIQIGDIVYPNKIDDPERENYEKKYPWIKNNPHWNIDKYKDKPNNCIYIASEKCSFDNSIKGYGLFNYNDELILTKENEPITHWKLNNILKEELTYHSKNSIKESYFQSAHRGQEFIFKQVNSTIENWAIELIKKYGRKI